MSIALLQKHKRASCLRLINMPELPHASAVDPESLKEDTGWLMFEVVDVLAKRAISQDLVGLICARIGAVRVVDALTVRAGFALSLVEAGGAGGAQAPAVTGKRNALLTVARKNYRYMLAEVCAGRPQNALRMMELGLHDAIKDNVLRSARAPDAPGHEQAQVIENTPASSLVEHLQHVMHEAGAQPGSADQRYLH